MEIYTDPADRPLPGSRPAVTLGVFDGVHRGHRKIIDAVRVEAARTGAPSLAVTFHPHPRQAMGRAAPPAIASLDRRLELLAEAGLDAVWVLPFTADFSRITGRDFAEEYFHRRLDARVVVLGEAAVFGRDREGSAPALAAWAADWGMTVTAVPPLVVDGAAVSSTAIRLAVQSGDLTKAEHFLGRRFEVEGTVVHGQGHGRKFGFPTLNLDPHHELRPPAGVYLSVADIAGNRRPSVTNIGRPPTENEIRAGLADFLIETHLLDYTGDLYGRDARVGFLRKMREVMRFSGPDELIDQVNMDLAAAREWFADHDGGDAWAK